MAEFNKEKFKEGNLLQTLQELDEQLTLSLSLCTSADSKLGYLRPYMKWLEYSCHGVFWIPGCFICLWLCFNPTKQAFFFNMLIALLLDIVCVSVLKASIRRSRPSNNMSEDMFLTVSVDKMSCPSGHTSRAVLMTLLLIATTPHLYLLHPIFIIWCICTSASRLLLGRHYLGDVLIGVLLGYVEYLIMDYIWAGPETAKWYMDIFGDSGLIEDI